MKKNAFILILFIMVYHAHNVDITFDTKITYIAVDTSMDDAYDGFVQQYLDKKSNGYTMLVLTRYLNHNKNIHSKKTKLF